MWKGRCWYGDSVQRLTITGPCSAEILTPGLPTGIASQVVVEVSACAISPRDVAAFRGGGTPDTPFGHEWSGRVVSVGDGAGGRFVGERVVPAPPYDCGTCEACRATNRALCQHVTEFLSGRGQPGREGAFAHQVVVDAASVIRLPEGIDDRDAVLIGPASAAFRAVRRSGISIGQTALVVGGGTLGLLVAQLLRLSGAGAVAAVDPDHDRRELACDLGCDAAFARFADAAVWLDRLGSSLGADVVIDCAGADGSGQEALKSVAPGGRIVVIGRAGGASPIDVSLLVEGQADLVTSLGFTRADVSDAMGLMSSDRFRVAPLLAEDVGLAEAPSRLATLGGLTALGRRVVVRP